MWGLSSRMEKHFAWNVTIPSAEKEKKNNINNLFLTLCDFSLPLFPGDDFSIIQQEIFMVKECMHHNIVAYFGSYLW